MPAQAQLYDLTLLLSMSADDDARAKILADVDSAITAAGGSVEHKSSWGTRTMTFRIRHEPEAEYHLLQFTGSAALLESLSHSLRIADEVLRFRIIKVTPGTPAPPETPPPVIAVAGASGTGPVLTGVVHEVSAGVDAEAVPGPGFEPGSGFESEPDSDE
jgi:small subunit ribosomal protein S6